MTNSINTNNATTKAQATKTTALFRVLVNNAKYTTKYISKKDNGLLFDSWNEAVNNIRINAFNFYKATALQVYKTEAEAEAEIKATEKAVYDAIRSLSALIGDIPTIDGKSHTRLNADIIFLDAVRLSVNDKAKTEIKALEDARDSYKTAKAELKKYCYNDNGTLKNGLNPDFVKAKEEAVKTTREAVDKLLTRANASVFATADNKQSKYLKPFEVAVRKAVTHKHNFTEAQAKAEKQAKNAEREANRSKGKGKTTAKAEAKAN